jgi:hypothetical protein
MSFLDPRKWLAKLRANTLKPRAMRRFWEFGDQEVTIPAGAGPMPGKLNTGKFPIFRGLYDLAQQRHCRHFALCASARVGKTLFSIVIMLYWLAERMADVVWLDPSGASAKKVSKSEIQPFIEACPPVWKLAILGKTTWQTLWKQFVGKALRIVSSGAEADLHGFNAELAIANETSQQKQARINRRGKTDLEEDSSPIAKITERTVLYPWTRLVIENSTPGAGGEFTSIWAAFQRGSQHHCYLPCPHCTAEAKRTGKRRKLPPELPVGWALKAYDDTLDGWQRLTFSEEKKLVPFDEDLLPLIDADGNVLPTEKWREESTGQFRFEQFAVWKEVTAPGDATKKIRKKIGYRMDALERDTTYQCAHCKKDILGVQINWMIERYRWVAHNPHAPTDRISAHVWRAYCPPALAGSFGRIAAEFLAAKKDIAALIKWTNLVLGLPFIRTGTAVKEADLERVIARTPVSYLKGQIPAEAEMLLMTVDKQESEFWYVIRAYGILWDHADWPTWSALVDWGRANSWDEILEIAGDKPDASGELRRFTWENPKTGEIREYAVTGGLVDSGNQAELVYAFCVGTNGLFEPYKGSAPMHTRWSPIRMSSVMDETLPLWLCWSNHFAAGLYYDRIKYGVIRGEPVHWWLPRDIDQDYREQLTDEYQEGDDWIARKKRNHLGDGEKMQIPLSGTVEEEFDAIRERRLAELENSTN